MADKEFEGKDLQEVLEAASEKLGIAEPDLDYEIVEQGRRGLFGVGTKNIRIRVMPPIDQLLGVPQPQRKQPPPMKKTAKTAKTESTGKRGKERSRRSKRSRRGGSRSQRSRRTPREAREPKEQGPPTPAPPEEVAAVGETLQKMIELIGLELTATSAASDSGVMVELAGPDTKLMLQKDRQLMSAVQFLLNRMARRTWPDTKRIQLSCEGQKRERDEELIERTRTVCEQVLETGRQRRLPEMNAYERRLVHITVRELEGLGSRSEGNGHLKRVRIFPADPRSDRSTDPPADAVRPADADSPGDSPGE